MLWGYPLGGGDEINQYGLKIEPDTQEVMAACYLGGNEKIELERYEVRK